MSTDEIDFLDGLTPDPPRPIQPAPAAPVVTPAPVGYSLAPPLPAKSRETLKFVALLVVVAVCSLSSGLLFAWLFTRHDSPGPGDYDRHFIAVGKAYLGDLGPAYASAWEDGAKVLDAGQPIGVALDTVAKSWEANRKAAGNKRLTPELSKVVEQGKDEKEVTTGDRAALAKAYRGIAKGLGGK